MLLFFFCCYGFGGIMYKKDAILKRLMWGAI
ncbi:Uncharacterised protein [Staphylococcus pseudintermedius]|nr:Uncharacterised protein [Staphylococcus pseudintermedius]